MKPNPRLAIFVSGSGTNMENLILKNRDGVFPGEIVFILSDQPKAKALEKAARLGVPSVVVERARFASKDAFEAEIIRHLETSAIDFVLLAGYMRILSAAFVKRFERRIINIHPSYLPAFPGGHSIRDAFEAGVKETGVTVHFVIEDVDAGPVILQRKVPVLPGDTLESLEKRVHEMEYVLYPEALSRALGG